MQQPLLSAREEQQLSHGCLTARLLSFLMPVHTTSECMHACLMLVYVHACMSAKNTVAKCMQLLLI